MEKKAILYGALTVFCVSIIYQIINSVPLTNIWILNQGINAIVSLVVFYILKSIWCYFKKKNLNRKNFKRIKSTNEKYKYK